MRLFALGVATTALAGVSAAVHIRAEYRGPRWQVYLCKPLTTALLLALALGTPGPVAARYQLAIAVGLTLSLIGDVFLMLPGDRFVAGLASFLAAHVAYLVALTTDVPLGTAPVAFAATAVAGGTVLGVLWPHLGRLRGLVAVYVAVIAAMAGQAWARAWTLHTTPALVAAAGHPVHGLGHGPGAEPLPQAVPECAGADHEHVRDRPVADRRLGGHASLGARRRGGTGRPSAVLRSGPGGCSFDCTAPTGYQALE